MDKVEKTGKLIKMDKFEKLDKKFRKTVQNWRILETTDEKQNRFVRRDTTMLTRFKRYNF